MRVFSRSSRWAAAGLLALALGALAPSSAEAKPQPGARRGFRLLARTLGAMTVNRVYLGLDSNFGNIGVDSTGSSTIGGGFWPRGTPNQFVFNSGLQIAGKIENPGGDWNGDRAGAFFFDPKGTTQHGEEIQPIYNFNDPGDAAAWPAAAIVAENPGAVAPTYNPALLGLQSASQGDIWFMTWDGNPTLIAGRQHPLGVVVESRGLGWNYPVGNEDIAYFIFTFYNITSTVASDYAGVRPDMQPILLEAAQQFKTRNEAQFGITIPANGYVIDSLFAAFAADMDVSAAGTNYCSVNLPFALGYCYEHTFAQNANEFYGDPTVWGPPFFAGPGFVGVKYLQSPTGPGEIQLFSNTINSATGFRDPQNVDQLYRYLSGNLSAAAGDQPCNVSLANHVCFINPVAADARFYQSSTALRLLPGGFGSIVVAYVFSAPVAIPGFTPTAATDVTPGNPLRLIDPDLLTAGANRIDSLTGFIGFDDRNGDGTVQQDEFATIKGSLLEKSLTAQLIFDNQFLLPFAPTSPQFYLVPGDNEVSVVWQPTVSETQGDPYFAVASDPGIPGAPNLLYDPNYRQFDVEGYRVYRGRVDNATQLTLLAQYDYAGTSMDDFTSQINPIPTCGPELGVTIDCPVPFDYVQGSGIAPTEFVTYPLVGQFIQVKLGSASRAVLSTGELLVVGNADTTLTSVGNGSFPELADTGVPFAFVDRDVRNNFRYFYSVTAFDINSFQSGPSSLESPRITKAVTPRVDGSNQVNAELTFGVLDAAGNPLSTSPDPTIDGATGRFSGPPAATNTVAALFAPVVPALFPVVDLTATIDSVLFRTGGLAECPVENGLGNCVDIFTSFTFNGTTTRFVSSMPAPIWSSFGDLTDVEAGAGAQQIPADPAALARYGVPANFTNFNASLSLTQHQSIDFSSLEGQAARRGRLNASGTAANGNPGGISDGGSRWFSGANETINHPAIGVRVGGGLPGADTVWAPIHHTDTLPRTPQPANGTFEVFPNSGNMQCFSYAMGIFSRNADTQVRWGAGGQVEVFDVSNQVPVLSQTTPGANYGFVPDGNGDGIISWADFEYLPKIRAADDYAGLGCGFLPGQPDTQLEPQPTLRPTTYDSRSGVRVPADVDGQGFGLYINGERYIFILSGGQFPAAGTVWTLRTYGGRVRTSAATAGTPAPAGYSIVTLNRASLIPGLQVQFTVANPTLVTAVTNQDLSRVHTVPDPYYVTNGYEATTDSKILQFVNLPSQAIIRIYTSSGILVNVIEHNSGTFGGSENWNLRNRNNQVVASGVYFYHIESGDARKVGRFTVVNFAQ